MKAYYSGVYDDILKDIKAISARTVVLNKVDCFYLHKQIKEQFEGVHELLTWDTGLAFNCEFYSHEELYANLFKLKYDGMQLGPEG